MGRPPLALGTAGAIRCYKTDTGYRARVLVRDYDGAVRAVERRGPTKAAAERALKTALRDRAPVHASGEITADSRVSALAEAWYAGLADLSPVTMQAYRDRLDRQILPGLGQLRVRELSIGVPRERLRHPLFGWATAVASMCPATANRRSSTCETTCCLRGRCRRDEERHVPLSIPYWPPSGVVIAARDAHKGIRYWSLSARRACQPLQHRLRVPTAPTEARVASGRRTPQAPGDSKITRRHTFCI